MNRIVYVISGYIFLILLLSGMGIVGTDSLGLAGSFIEMMQDPTTIQESIFWKGVALQFALTIGASILIGAFISTLGVFSGDVSQAFWRDPKTLLTAGLMGSIIVPIFQSLISLFQLFRTIMDSNFFAGLIMIPFIIPMLLVAYDWFRGN